MALWAGHTLFENIDELVRRFPLNKSGFFGKKGKGRSHTRNIESADPARTAYDFAQLSARIPSSVTTIAGKGIVYTMRDGSVVTYRFYSSSADHSPVVELKVQGIPGVKSQKIHFVKKGK